MTRGATDPTMLRWINAAAILRHLHQSEPKTSAQLAQDNRSARSTVEEALNALVAKHLVVGLEPETSTPRRGRPARRYQFRGAAGLVAGIGVDHLGIRVIVTDLNGTTIAEHAHPLADPVGSLDLANEISASLAAAVTSARVPATQRLMAAAVGLPGIIDGTGRILRCVPAPQWVGLCVPEVLAPRLSCPVAAENHSRLAVVGEGWRGGSQGDSDVLFLLCGVRVGVGMLVNGAVVRGLSGAAAEIGRIPELAVAAGFRSHLAELLPNLAPEHAAEYVFRNANDARFAQFRADYVAGMARVAGALVQILAPQRVVIGGAFAHADAGMLADFCDRVAAATDFPPAIGVSGLGDDAIAIGAVRSALSIVEETLFDPHALLELSI